MTTVIKDSLTGNTARVNSDNQLEVFSTQRTQLSQALLEDNAYIITTPFINLTTASESGLLHVKNTDTETWIISRLFINAGTSDATGDHSFKVLYQSSGGTLISGGTPFDAANLKAGSAQTLDATIVHGAEGSTVSGGNGIVDSIVPTTGARTAVTDDNFVLPAGTSLQITLTPPTGNTSMNAQVGILLHRFTKD